MSQAGKENDPSESRPELGGIFACLVRLLHQGPQSVEGALGEVARSFRVSSAGLCTTPGFEPALRHVGGEATDRLPWDENAEPMQKLRGRAAALALPDAAGSWLVAQVWEPCFGNPLLVWLRHSGQRHWSDEEAAALPIAGQTLLRLAAQADDSNLQGLAQLGTRRHLDQAAIVASRLSHDFGNILTGILGFAELSRAQVASGTPVARYLDEVVEAARGGANWVRKLHLFCRRDASTHWPTSLPETVQPLVTSPSFASIRHEVALPPDLPLLAIDAEALATVLGQLLENAREALGGSGTVSITGRRLDLTLANCAQILGNIRPGTAVEITISDSGPGLTPEARAKLFTEVFFSTKPRQRGLGLLAAYGILKRFYGGLRLHTAALSTGCLVRVYVPAAVLPPAPELQGVRFLSALADRSLSASLARVLQEYGCAVTQVGGAQEALVAFQASPRFDLIIIEVRAPQPTAFEIARRMQERDPSAAFLFVQTSPYPAQVQDERLKKFPVLGKPFDPPRFLAAARAVLQTRPPRMTGAQRDGEST